MERTFSTEIEGNHFDGLSTAVVSQDSPLRFEGNSLTDCDLAFEVLGVGAHVVITLNAIQGASRLIENRSTFEVTAERNWWGTDDEAWVAARMSGIVQWRPVLNFDPRLPVDFALSQSFPNPFNGSTVIDYSIGINQAASEDAEMSLEIRDTVGGLVRRLVRAPAGPGIYSSVWDGNDARGFPVASGTYFYLLQVGPHRLSRKLMVVR